MEPAVKSPIKPVAERLAFHYSDAPQRSPEWLDTKRGKIGASRLSDWLAVSKAKNSTGKPLKARLDYEKELMFERQFGVSFNVYVTDAMQDGIDFEDFARAEYEKITGNIALECGCWYNDFFVASPDRLVGDNGLIEIKIVKDNTFVDVLMDGVPDKHWKQIQGQLWATGREWCDYVCVNFTTRRVVIIRVLPDTEFHEYLAEAVQEELVTEPFSLTNVHELPDPTPDWARQASAAELDRSDSNTSNNDWSK
jgi:exodeoxyribonuclease (lambda-induced)